MNAKEQLSLLNEAKRKVRNAYGACHFSPCPTSCDADKLYAAWSANHDGFTVATILIANDHSIIVWIA